MYPIILVVSYGQIKSAEIVDNIIEAFGATKSNQEENTCTFPTILTEIKTKYYQNTVAFLPFDGDVQSIPSDIWERTESMIIYFDSLNKSFLKEVTPLCDLLQKNNIEMGLLLTDKLNENSNEGITYTDIKSICGIMFDIIELCTENVEVGSNEDAQRNYDEVLNALMNHVWSNVNISKSESSRRQRSNSESDTENQLDAFENLLSSIQNFKKTSSGLKREEVLDQAEKLAELFACVLTED